MPRQSSSSKLVTLTHSLLTVLMIELREDMSKKYRDRVTKFVKEVCILYYYLLTRDCLVGGGADCVKRHVCEKAS